MPCSAGTYRGATDLFNSRSCIPCPTNAGTMVTVSVVFFLSRRSSARDSLSIYPSVCLPSMQDYSYRHYYSIPREPQLRFVIAYLRPRQPDTPICYKRGM